MSLSGDLLSNKDLVDIDYNLLAKQNFLSKYWNEKQTTVIFFLETTLKAIKSPRCDLIYRPIFRSINEVQTLCSEYTWSGIKKQIVKYVKNKLDDDAQFYKNNPDLYEFIIFSLYASPISFNRVSLIKLKIPCSGIFDSKSTRFDYHNEEFNDIGQEIFQFKVEHLPEKEEQFAEKKKSNGSCFLYHGSKIENWYSILKNGIKNCSNNTDLKLNGAAYGEGVYLSDNMGTSYTYSAFNVSNNYSNDARVIAVFEVLGNKEMYKKISNIYVVKDSNKLILRYIIRLQVSEELVGNISAEFNNYFNKLSLENRKIICKGDSPKVIEKKEINGGKHVKTKKEQQYSRINRRLMKELKDVDNISTEQGISVIVDEANVRLWKCYLSNFDENTLLGKDMLEKNVNKIELEIRMPEYYPFDPPFIRVVYPRFMFHTGHITIGGSICMELLTNQGWSPSYCIESLLTQIKAQLIIGDAQLDTNKWKVPYTFQEAQDAFRRVAIQHGWMR